MKEKLDLLIRVPESAIERAASTLLDLRQSWEWATKEERRMLVRTMIQEVGCDVGTKRIVWVKVKPDYEILFRLIDGLDPGAERCYWIRAQGTEGNTKVILLTSASVGYYALLRKDSLIIPNAKLHKSIYRMVSKKSVTKSHVAIATSLASRFTAVCIWEISGSDATEIFWFGLRAIIFRYSSFVYKGPAPSAFFG